MVFFLRNPNLRSMDIKFIYLKSVVLQDILYFSTCSLQCIYYNNSNVLNYYNTILYCTILYYYTWLLSLPVHSVLCRIIIRWRRIILTGMRGNEVLASLHCRQPFQLKTLALWDISPLSVIATTGQTQNSVFSPFGPKNQKETKILENCP